MKTLGTHKIEFPETPDEAKTWIPVISKIALHCRVLCVAKTRIEGTWKAYCRDVPGNNHEIEMALVLYDGDALPHDVARCLFPIFHGIDYAG